MDYNFPHIDGIDWEKAYHYMPTKEVLLEILKEFVASCDEQIAELKKFEKAVEENPSRENYSSYRIQAHAMKAGLRSIGSNLFDMALMLEEAGRHCNGVIISEKTEIFTQRYRELADRLVPLAGTGEETEFDTSRFFELVDNVRKGMDSFDISLLQNSMRDIKCMTLPEKYMDEVGKLESAVRDLSMEDVFASCDRIRVLGDNK